MLNQYSEVFKDEIGTLRGTKERLSLKTNSKPVFHKARPAPYALCPKIDAELQRLEQASIISKVEWSEWASPVVPIVKQNGDIRLCGDFNVSINSSLQVDQYPLLSVEDILATLAGGKKFSKLDLCQAYLQMEMEEDQEVPNNQYTQGSVPVQQTGVWGCISPCSVATYHGSDIGRNTKDTMSHR